MAAFSTVAPLALAVEQSRESLWHSHQTGVGLAPLPRNGTFIRRPSTIIGSEVCRIINKRGFGSIPPPSPLNTYNSIPLTPARYHLIYFVSVANPRFPSPTSYPPTPLCPAPSYGCDMAMSTGSTLTQVALMAPTDKKSPIDLRHDLSATEDPLHQQSRHQTKVLKLKARDLPPLILCLHTGLYSVIYRYICCYSENSSILCFCEHPTACSRLTALQYSVK